MNGPTRVAALLCLALAAGCKNDSQELVPDAGVVRAVHAIPDLGALTMNLDSSSLGDFDFGGIRGLNRPGDGNHEISFDVRLPGGADPTRLETMNVATGVDRAQTIVLTGTADQPTTFTWEQPARDWDSEIANADDPIEVLEISFGHAALSRGPLDFYIGPSPLDPTTSTPVASVGYQDLSPIVEIDAEIQEIIVTPAGDPTTQLYESDALALPPATSLLFVAFDGAKLDGDTPWLAMRSLGEAFSDSLPNKKVSASARGIHVARGVASLDIVRDSNDTTLISGLEFLEVSPYAAFPTGTNALNIVLTADPAELIATTTFVATAGSDSTIVIAGQPDSESTAVMVDDTRRIANVAKFRVVNGDVDFRAIDAYLLEPGTDVEDVSPTFAAVTYPFGSGYVGFAAGDYDLAFTETGSKDLIAGPTRVTFQNTGIYGVVLTEATENDHADLFFVDDLADE